MKKEIKLSDLEKRLLYNFVIGERNRISYHQLDSIKERNNELSIEIKIQPSYTNLNNFDGNIKEYTKALNKLVKKLN